MLAKPSKLDRAVSKWQKQTVRQREKQARERQAQRKWRALSAMVRHRDRECCRVCEMPTELSAHGDPRLIGQAHHIVYRSAGGSDDLSNLVWLCGRCHNNEHQHRICLTGDATSLHIERLESGASR